MQSPPHLRAGIIGSANYEALKRLGARRTTSVGILGVTGLVMLVAGCAHRSDQSSVDTRFQRLANDFIATHFSSRPLAGVALGWHQYDGKFVVPDKAALATEAARLKRFETAFASLPADRLSATHRHELHLIQSTIAYDRWVRERQRVFWRNPMAYAGDMWSALDISIYLKRDFKPLPERIADITTILRTAPGYLEVARANLEPVLPKPFVETAIESANGTATFIENDVAKVAAEVADGRISADYEAAMKPAASAFRVYADWLKREKLPRADNSFALGRDGCIAMLKTEFVDLTPEQILEIGLRELRAEQKRFAEAAAVIDPNLKPAEAARLIQREHPTAEELIPSARKTLESIRQFLIDRRIVTIPSEVRPRVEETLPPFRATGFASMDTPGPFEIRATEAYYYITPVEPHWTPKQAEEWLSAFNYYTTDIVSIHEAYPGHYVQFLALNASPASTIAKVFNSNPYSAGSYAFIEGWAHYTEQMMIEEGFGQPANPVTASETDRARGARYHIAQSIEALLRLCRLCCSIKLHAQGMSVGEATRFFMENAYYEEKPARSEATRGTYDPGYLYYSLGKLMILKLRNDWRGQEGACFTLQRFHDEFLRHGAPPIPLLRQIMLKDPKQWPKIL
jgi:uncharacterized protein (DUF885 family)